MADTAWDQANKQVKKPPAPKPPDPSTLGSGAAAKAGEKMKERKGKLDKALEDAGI